MSDQPGDLITITVSSADLVKVLSWFGSDDPPDAPIRAHERICAMVTCPECDSPKTPDQTTCGLMACDMNYAERMYPDA